MRALRGPCKRRGREPHSRLNVDACCVSGPKVTRCGRPASIRRKGMSPTTVQALKILYVLQFSSIRVLGEAFIHATAHRACGRTKRSFRPACGCVGIDGRRTVVSASEPGVCLASSRQRGAAKGANVDYAE